MRNLLIFMFLVAIFVVGKRSCNGVHFGFNGIRGEGPIQTETRSVTNFHAVDLQISGNVEVSVGESYFVEVSAQQNILPIIKTTVENGALRIYCDENLWSSGEIKVRVTAPAFDRFDVGGSGIIRLANALKSERLYLSVSGSGDIKCPQIETGNLEANIAGSGAIELGGTSSDLRADIAGSGDVRAKALTTQTLRVNISGSGSVSADVTTSLRADISGSGDVFYSGSPTVESNISGSGKVQKTEVQ
ncbi:MAG: head GIN domain-containing protein [Saprospiraceae bacterium]|nr:head GIN domain-containing protein [Saprospiraceae bacterium]